MKLITTLANSRSKIDKQRILKVIERDEWKTFVFAYDPYAVYNLKFKDFDLKALGEPNKAMFDLLDDILDGTVPRGATAKQRVETFAAEHGDLIKLVVNKDLRCGVNATLFNSVHRNSIDQFKVQLAKEVPVIDLSYPLLAQLKYDGVRIIAVNDCGDTGFFTRNGKEVVLPKLKEILDRGIHTNYVLDGELTLISGKQEDRVVVSGMVNSAMHGGSVIETNLRLNCFDFMKLSDWSAAKCDEQYRVRFSNMSIVLEDIESDHFIPAVTLTIATAEDANEYYQEVIEAGYEGLILKSETHKYSFKRSKDWVKVKETKEADLKCIGWQVGKGKYAGIIGALVCTGEVEGKSIEVNVAGLSIMAAAIDPDINYIGKTIEVKYNAVIQDAKTGGWSLFLPRFSCVRFDK